MNAIWRKTTMGDAFEMYQPRTLSQTEINSNGSYKVYGANGVIGTHTEFNHEESQILITCRGATCGTINVSEPKSWINGNAMVIKPRSNDVDKNFLKHYLIGGVDLSKAITGAAQPQITRQSLNPIQISLPPLAEQKRIAALLDTAVNIMRLREQAIAKLDELALSKFNELDDRAVKQFKLSEICEIVSGATPKTDNKNFWNGDICWVTPRELSDMTDIYISDTERKITCEGRDSCAVSVLPINSVLFSSRAPIGHLAINTVPMTTNQGFKSFVVNENIVKPLYLYYWLKSRKVKIQNLGVGATFKEVSKSIVSSIDITLPAVQMQDAFQSDVLKIRDMKIKQMNSLKKIKSFVASLQHQSFSVN